MTNLKERASCKIIVALAKELLQNVLIQIFRVFRVFCGHIKILEVSLLAYREMHRLSITKGTDTESREPEHE